MRGKRVDALMKTRGAISTLCFGRLDVLVSNAGVFTPKPFLEATESEYDWFLDTILKGSFFAAQAAAKAMPRFSCSRSASYQ
jgi:NAD(P)-dependent dehydrogenase (short-subunit alcohol dehydrogenase family)